jgi:hypothetical protein
MEGGGQTITRMVERPGSEKETGILYVTTLKFVYRHAANPAAPDPLSDPKIAEVEADIACEYMGLPEGYTQHEVEQFGARSVLAHVWPFWREFLHSAFLRMSLPPTTLPPLFIPSGNAVLQPSAETDNAAE